MLSGCWITVQLLLLLLPPVTETQSGDGDTDMEPRISCTSHISNIVPNDNSLTCKLVGGRNDNEDDEDDDGIKEMRVCYNDWATDGISCLEGPGDTVRGLIPVINLDVKVILKRGGEVTSTVVLKNIVKPRSPQVWNVTFNNESNQAVIYIQTPYHREYLKVENQLFQLLIWTAGSSTIQNVSSLNVMTMDMEHLKGNTEYHVKVRAIPQEPLQGTWSEWSETFSFFTPEEKKEEDQKPQNERQDMYTLIVCLVLFVVVIFSVVFFWKNKIFTYVWPSIPHPKHTLVQICKPNRGLLLNLKPEVFSALKVSPMEQPCEETQPSITAAAVGTQSNQPCSTQSSDCSRSTTSVSTEELELSALLSRSSSDSEDSLQSNSPSPTNVLQLRERPLTPQPELSSGGNEAEVLGVGQQEEAYVTMSSFYQIK